MYKAIVSAKGHIVIPAELRRKYSAVFVGLEFFLLSGGKDYRIAHNYGIIDWDRLTDSLSSWAEPQILRKR